MKIAEISILLPYRDAAATLEAALRSIERQTFRDWQCVLVDDGSTDQGPQIVESFQRRDPRFQSIRTETRGLVAALQEGADRCRGRLVARKDADDLMHSNRLARQVESLEENPDWQGCGTYVRMFPRPAPGSGMRAYEDWLHSQRSAEDIAGQRFIECPVAHPTWMLRREALQQCGYRDAGWTEDWDLLLRWHAVGFRFGVVPERLLGWRRSADSYSATHPACSRPQIDACRAHHIATGVLGETDRFVLWGYGSTGRRLTRALEKLGKRPSVILERHPGRIGSTIQGAPVVPFEQAESYRDHPLLISLKGEVPRTAARSFLNERGFSEGRNYFFCA